jgi:hypothetical protein
VVERPAGRECDYEGQRDTCATEQEVEDAAIVTAQLGVDVDVAQTDHAALSAEIQDYCNQNPWDCEGTSVETPPFTSGPTPCGAKSKCYEQAVTALVALGAAAATHLAVAGAIIDAGAAGVTVLVKIDAVRRRKRSSGRPSLTSSCRHP